MSGVILAEKYDRFSNADLESLDLDGDERQFKAIDLWRDRGAVIMAIRRPGCMLCRAAAEELFQLKPQLDKAGIPLCGIVHENIPMEISRFRPFFDTELFLDREKKFFGAKYLGYLGFLKPSFWLNRSYAQEAGIQGNSRGEGRIPGGCYVIGPDDHGIVLDFPEKNWGDKPPYDDVVKAVKKLIAITKSERTAAPTNSGNPNLAFDVI